MPTVEAEEKLLTILKQVMEEKLTATNIEVNTHTHTHTHTHTRARALKNRILSCADGGGESRREV